MAFEAMNIKLAIVATNFICCLITGKMTLAQTVNLSGYVREATSQENLPGVSVYLAGKSQGTNTNDYGYYSLTVPCNDTIEIVYSMVGYNSFSLKLAARQSVSQTIFLNPQVQQLAEIKVSSAQQESIRNIQMSSINLPIQHVKNIPALLGEKDVLKALQLLPGVQKGNEGQTGLYVRGGGPDQNLLILDDAVVYNASHLFGFFSVFNTDALKNIDLIKGGFPAQYGGRLSSVISMQLKDGNKEKMHGEGGVGLIASRLTLEGPLKKNISSFLLSARRTYADALLKPFVNGKFPSIYFYDLNAKVNYNFGKSNQLFISGYFGRDAADFTSNTSDGSQSKDGFNWGNATATLRWNYVPSPRIFIHTSAIYSRYQFKVYSDESGLKTPVRFLQEYNSGIRDFSAKLDIDYSIGANVQIKSGFLLTAHRFTPSAFVLRNIDKDSVSVQSVPIDALEGGLYMEGIVQASKRIKLNAGLRLSYFKVNQRTYLNPEPRFALMFSLQKNWFLKTSYSRMNQYMHMLSNSGLGLPTDLWIPATNQILPQKAQQVSLGIEKLFVQQNLLLSIEAYHKQMQDIIGYKDGASFLILNLGPNPKRVSQVDWQSNVTSGNGRSYGVEFFLQRKTGTWPLAKLTGWIGYTLSWSTQQFDLINDGKEFFAHFDRRHDISVVGIYQIAPRICLSTSWVFGTGNALTVPIGTEKANGHTFFGAYRSSEATIYGQRNAFRAAPYHRLDLTVRFQKNKRWGNRTWEVGVYNCYNRINPYYYKIRTSHEGVGSTGEYKQSLARYGLFPVIPTVGYSIQF